MSSKAEPVPLFRPQTQDYNTDWDRQVSPIANIFSAVARKYGDKKMTPKFMQDGVRESTENSALVTTARHLVNYMNDVYNAANETSPRNPYELKLYHMYQFSKNAEVVRRIQTENAGGNDIIMPFVIEPKYCDPKKSEPEAKDPQEPYVKGTSSRKRTFGNHLHYSLVTEVTEKGVTCVSPRSKTPISLNFYELFDKLEQYKDCFFIVCRKPRSTQPSP